MISTGKANRECALEDEYNHLRVQAKKAAAERNQEFTYVQNITGYPLFEVRNWDSNTFAVTRARPERAEASFFFDRENNRIVVQDENPEPLYLTVTLNDEGRCRFKINGKGEFLRWQVFRKTLEKLFCVDTEALDKNLSG